MSLLGQIASHHSKGIAVGDGQHGSARGDGGRVEEGVAWVAPTGAVGPRSRTRGLSLPVTSQLLSGKRKRDLEPPSEPQSLGLVGGFVCSLTTAGRQRRVRPCPAH